MPLEVIGSGFGRCGTKGLKFALDTLGYKTYHACVLITENDSHIASWNRACLGDLNAFDRIFSGYTAACGFPACSVYKELLSKNPNAKVVHVVRDFDSWYGSVIVTLYPRYKMLVSVPWYIKMIARRIYLLQVLSEVSIWERLFDGKFEDKEHARRVYLQHREEVEKLVPPEQLLIYDLKEGWGPLCSFLDKPVPVISFPRINDTQHFRDETEDLKGQVRRVSFAVNVGLAIVVGTACYFLGKRSGLVELLKTQS